MYFLYFGRLLPYLNNYFGGIGEVAERLKAHAWKACFPVRGSRVRIPPSPHWQLEYFNLI